MNSFSYSRSPIVRAVVAIGLLCAASTAQGQSTWTRTAAGTYTWSDTGNWTNGVPNAAGAAGSVTANAAGNQVISLNNQQITLGTLTIGDTNNTHTYTIQTGTLLFNGNGSSANLTQVSTSKGDTISAALTLGSNLNITNDSSNTLTLGAVANNGFSITKLGSGTLSFSSAGATSVTVNAGVLTGILTNVSPTVNNGGTVYVMSTFSMIGQPVTVNAGGRLLIGPSGSPQSIYVLNSGTVSGADASGQPSASTGAMMFRGGGMVSTGNSFVGNLAGITTYGGFSAVTNVTSGTLTYASAVFGPNTGITKTGAGLLIMSGSNSHTGGTAVNSGTLLLNAGAGGAMLTTGTLSMSGNGAVFNYDNTTASGAKSQAMGAVNFTAGDATVMATRTAAQAVTLSFGSFTRSVGATGNFAYAGTPGTIGTDTSINITGAAAGFLNQGLFYQGDYAWLDGAGTFVRGINYGTDAATESVTASTTALSGTTLYAKVSGVGQVTGQTTGTITTLSIANGNDFTLASGQTLTLNGITKTGNAAGGRITGGSGIQTGSNAEIVIRTDGAADTLNINTPILANGTNAVTKLGAGKLVISSSIAYTGPTTISTGTLEFTNNANQTLSGIISGSGSLVYSGTGALTLSGANTYSGGTTLNSGALIFSANANLGAAGSPLTVVGPGSLSTSGLSWTFDHPIAIQSGTVNIGGGAGLNFSAPLTGTGAVILNAGAPAGYTFSNAGNTFSGQLGLSTPGNSTSSYNFASLGDSATNAIILGNGNALGNFGYTGASQLTLNRPILVGSNSTITSGGGGIVLNGTMSVTGGSARTVTVSTGTASGITSSGPIIDGGAVLSVTKNGSGTLIVSGSNTYSGVTTVSAGVLEFKSIANSGTGNASSLGAPTSGNAAIQLANDAILRYTGTGGHSSDRTINLSTTGTGSATLDASGSGPVTLGGASAAASFSKTLILTGSNAGNNSIGVISQPATSGTTSVLKTGTGTWVLSGSSDYRGTTRVDQGTLILAASAQNPNTNGGLGANSSAVITIGNAAGSGTAALLLRAGVQVDTRILTVPTGSQLTVLGGANTTGTATFGSAGSAEIQFQRDIRLQAGTGGTVVFANIWSATGGGSVPSNNVTIGTSDNAGTVRLNSVLGTTGAVNASYGTLRLGVTGALPSASAINIGVAGTSSAEVDYAATGETISRNVFALGNGRNRIRNSGGGTLTLSGTLTKDGTILELAGGTFNVTGPITGTSASSDLYVNGATVTLTNANNNYNGPTYVYGNGTLVLGASNVVPTGSALILGGTGGGDAGTGSIVTGTFTDTLASLTTSSQGSTVGITLGGGTGGSLTTTGNVSFGAGTDTLALTLSSNLTGGRYQLINYQGALSGTFDSVSGLNSFNGSNYTVVYGGASNSSIDLQMKATQAASLPYTQPTSGTVNAFVSTNVAFSGTLANTTPTGGAALAVNLAGNGGQLTVGGLSASTGSTVAANSAATITGTIATGVTLGSRTWTVVNTDTSALTSPTSTASGVVNVFAHGTPTVSSTTVNFGNVLVGSTAAQLLTVSNGTASAANTGGITWTANSTPSGFGTGGSSQPGVIASGSGVGYTYTLATGSAGSLSGSQTFTFADDSSILGAGSLGGQTVSLLGNVFDPATALLVGGTMSGSNWVFDLGEFQQVAGGTSSTLTFGIANLLQSASFTADLNLATFSVLGDTSTIFSSLTGTSSFATLSAGGTNSFTSWMSLSSTGSFANTYTLSFDSTKDGSSLGGTPQSVTFTVKGVVVVPEPATLALAAVGIGLGGWATLRRRRK